MDRCGIRAACIVPHLGIGPDFRGSNDLMLEALRKFPGRFFGLAIYNPHFPEESLADLERSFRAGAIGIKIHPDTHLYPVTGRNYEPAWKFARQHRSFVLSHTWGDQRCHPDFFLEIARSYPSVRFILGHSGGGPGGHEAAIRVAVKAANIFLDTCGSAIPGWWLERLADGAGIDRLLLGTDCPFIDPRPAVGRILMGRFSEAEKRAILGGNFRKHFLAGPAGRKRGRTPGARSSKE